LATAVAKPIAKPGDRGPVVMSVQRALGGLPVSGWFGPKTTAAVKAFQAKKKLPVTGVVDMATAKALGLR
jgi:peptidoglycan hydrolase-like protein with peptidoglycan-binding domain